MTGATRAPRSLAGVPGRVAPRGRRIVTAVSPYVRLGRGERPAIAGAASRAACSTTTRAPGASAPAATSASTAGGTSARAAYGGSAKTEIEGPGQGAARGAAGDRPRDDVRGALEAEGSEVLPQRGERGAGALDERRARRPAGEGLDAERAGAGVEIEHPGAADVAERREERLAHAVARGTRRPPAGGHQPAAAEAAGDHAHVPAPAGPGGMGGLPPSSEARFTTYTKGRACRCPGRPGGRAGDRSASARPCRWSRRGRCRRRRRRRRSGTTRFAGPGTSCPCCRGW